MVLYDYIFNIVFKKKQCSPQSALSSYASFFLRSFAIRTHLQDEESVQGCHNTTNLFTYFAIGNLIFRTFLFFLPLSRIWLDEKKQQQQRKQ